MSHRELVCKRWSDWFARTGVPNPGFASAPLTPAGGENALAIGTEGRVEALKSPRGVSTCSGFNGAVIGRPELASQTRAVPS